MEATTYETADIDADFCMIAKGDCMKNARIMDGDVVFFKRQEQYSSGDILAVKLDGNPILKRYYATGKGNIVLMPENSAYEPILTDESHIEILGKAVAIQSKLI